MNVLHLVKVRFDRRFPGATQEWFDRRVAFFRDYTWRSLKAQTRKDWRVWVNVDDAETMRMVYGAFEKAFGPGSARLEGVWSAGDYAPAVSPDVLSGVDYVYITRIDSDDLFAPDALAWVRSTTPTEAGAVETSTFRRGYMHDVNSGKVSVYCSDSSPFHTLMLPRGVFTDPVKYRGVFDKVGDHSLVTSSGYRCHGLPDWKFTVLIHGANFLSDMGYRAERGTPVERAWSVDRFLQQPVIFDVDDFCDDHPHRDVLGDLDQLAAHYPHFACTLFTIPGKTSPELLRAALTGRPWLELGVHGVTHSPNQELKVLTPLGLSRHLTRLRNAPEYARVFRAPGWYISKEHVKACDANGYAVALHANDRHLGHLAGGSGYYYCDARTPHWHGHTHDVCGNWVRKCLPELLTRWPKDQAFGKVSDAVLVPQR